MLRTKRSDSIVAFSNPVRIGAKVEFYKWLFQSKKETEWWMEEEYWLYSVGSQCIAQITRSVTLDAIATEKVNYCERLFEI